jgi:hypothetical protein
MRPLSRANFAVLAVVAFGEGFALGETGIVGALVASGQPPPLAATVALLDAACCMHQVAGRACSLPKLRSK